MKKILKIFEYSNNEKSNERYETNWKKFTRDFGYGQECVEGLKFERVQNLHQNTILDSADIKRRREAKEGIESGKCSFMTWIKSARSQILLWR